jgi:hypothetical protein
MSCIVLDCVFWQHQNSSSPFVFHHSMEFLCDGYCYVEKLLMAVLTYDGEKILGCM